MTLKEVTDWMMQNGYMVCIKGKYRVTSKFTQELSGSPSSALTVTKSENDWVTAYLDFIKAAEVPVRGFIQGKPYDLNKYSEVAMKAFRKMIESEGIVYAVLVKSTMLYYKTRTSYPVTVGRYIAEGFWRTDYLALLNSAQDGNLQEHIQKTIDDGSEFNRIQIG